MNIISEHHKHVIGLLEMLHRVADRHRLGEKTTAEDETAGFAYIENNERLASQVSPVLPLVPYEMTEALIAYMKENQGLRYRKRGRSFASFDTGLARSEFPPVRVFLSSGTASGQPFAQGRRHVASAAPPNEGAAGDDPNRAAPERASR